MKKIKILVLISVILLVSCKYDIINKLPGGYGYVPEGSPCHNSFIDKDNNVLNFRVNNLKFNENFIVFKVLDSLKCANNDLENLKDEDYRYYIYDIENKVNFGPLEKQVYKTKFSNLKISTDLDLDK
jgi:Protein of unknown function (DUF3997)